MPVCSSSYPTLPLCVNTPLLLPYPEPVFCLWSPLTCGNPYLTKTQAYHNITISKQLYILLNLQRTLVQDLRSKKGNEQAEQTQSHGKTWKTLYTVCLNTLKSTLEKVGLKGPIQKFFFWFEIFNSLTSSNKCRGF